MSGLEDNARAGIMVVDDNPANLKLLEDMLRQKGYHVRSFLQGSLALKSASRNPPDLILLDVNMPEMGGFEVCERVKAIEEFPGIPVLFISARDQTEDKVSGFRAGGVDYIAKPFEFEELHARVETHLKLRRAQQAERDLLELTLNGAIRMLADMVQSNSPGLAVRSRAIRDCVAWITQRMSVNEPWQYDLAATLCLIGCVTLPEEVFKRGYAGETISAEDEAMFRAHPESAARLLKNLPRLEPIAEMIRLQQSPCEADPQVSAEVKFGALLLFLAIELDRRLYRGVEFRTALREIRQTQRSLDPAIVSALDAYTPTTGDFHRRALPIKELSPGMILEEDVTGELTKALIQRKGTVLTGTWIERLENFARSHGVKEPLPVLVPGRDRVPGFPARLRSAPENNPPIRR
jgi:CheY-like chemotaxis protein